MLYYCLLVLYIMVFSWWIKSSSSLSIKGLTPRSLIAIFIFKIVIGLLYGGIHFSYFNGGDTFLYLHESTRIAETFFSYPSYYISSLLGLEVAIPSPEVFTYPDRFIFWKDLGSYAIVHIHALLYPFTQGSNYELHIFFIAVMGFFASINYYKVFDQILSLPRSFLLFCCFGLPSLTFWTSGLHKDAYVYFGISCFLVALFNIQQGQRFIRPLLTSIIIIALTRHYLLALLVPAAVGYLITLQYPNQKIRAYLIVYSCFLLLSLAISSLFFDISLFEILAKQQNAFLTETGNSAIKSVVPFDPSFWGILSTIPMAIINVLSRPFLWECRDFLQILASIEVLLFFALFSIALFMRKENKAPLHPLVYFIVFYTMSHLLLVGILVANIGTIARYRAIPIGLLSTLFMHIGEIHKTPFKSSKSNKQQHSDQPLLPNKERNKAL